MKRLQISAIAALGVAPAGPALAQSPAAPAGTWQAVTQQVAMPSWTPREGENWLSFRSPMSSLYLTVGGHAGFSTSTSLTQIGSAGCPVFDIVIGCGPLTPSSGLGTGGGGTFGIGARLTPVFRVALTFTAEGGYRFNGTVQLPGTNTYLQTTARVRSFQGAANLYADLGGILNTGRWNPFVMAGLGVAANSAGDMFINKGINGSPPFGVFSFPRGGTHASFMWTAGAGVQYQLAPGATVDLSYQYVDSGSFRFDSGGAATASGAFELEGNLRTHRLGLGVTIAINNLAQLVAGR